MEDRVKEENEKSGFEKNQSLDEQLQGMTIEEIDTFLKSWHGDDNHLEENTLDNNFEDPIEFR